MTDWVLDTVDVQQDRSWQKSLFTSGMQGMFKVPTNHWNINTAHLHFFSSLWIIQDGHKVPGIRYAEANLQPPVLFTPSQLFRFLFWVSAVIYCICWS